MYASVVLRVCTFVCRFVLKLVVAQHAERDHVDAACFIPSISYFIQAPN